MGTKVRRRGVTNAAGIALVLALTVIPALAYKVKDPKDALDALTFARPELWVTAQHQDLNEVRGVAPVPVVEAFDELLTREGVNWVMVFDRITGKPALMEGQGIPWIPGTANDLTGEALGLGLGTEGKDVPVEAVADRALRFIEAYPDLMGVNPDDLRLMPVASGPMLDYLYFVDFQWTYHGIPVEKAHLVFRLNHGNLVQVGQEYISPTIAKLDPNPTISADTAWEIVWGYADRAMDDRPVNRGYLLVVPVSRPEALSGLPVAPGEGLEYRLVYVLSFRRPGVMGTWEARVDAHTGEILSFADSNRYGKVHGGTYPTDQPATEVDRPFPYADTGLAAPNNYADGGGLFPGDSATSTLTGKYVDIVDNCGAISHTTAAGDLDFGISPDTDCVTPGFGGAGNTRASRTQFYHVTMVKMKALTYMPGNTWLQGVLTDRVNLNQTCNAYWDYTAVNFFRSGGGCWNTGELPGVSLHEWAHGMDSNDGSAAGDKGTGETYGDFTGSLQTHGSCAGGGFFYTMNRGCGNATIGFNCGGYGDCCLDCSGIRELDYAKRASGLPTFAEDLTSNTCAGCTPFACSTSGTYAGPCGYEGHCESLISSQAMWDLPVRDLTAWGLDIDTAWQTMDRYWYASRGTSSNAYACPSLTTTNGCGAGNYFTTFRVVDDCDGDLSNGTPHATAIYAAFNRHKIACTTVVNTDQAGCCPTFTPNPPVLSASAGSNSAALSWGTVTNATKYYVYRNESGCSAGYTKVGTVNAPTTTFTDTTVVNGVTYYYRLQGIGTSDACTTSMSNCATVTPQPCAGAVALDGALYNCADTVQVSVLDSTPGSSPWTALAWSTTDATQKAVTLTNNPPGSATYTGSFATTTGAAGAGQVRVSHGDTLTVQFTDPDYCGTPNQTVTATASVDCQGPAISSVQVSNRTEATARITWTTDEAANSRVTYGIAAPPGTNQDDLTLYATGHTIDLAGLTPCTTYYFSVTSADAAGNATTDANGGSYYTFMTTGRGYGFGPETVEGATTNWTMTGQWHVDTCKAHSGSNAFKAGSATCPGTYNNSTTSDLTWTQDIALGSSGHGYRLRYWEFYQTESGYDYCRPQISTNGGSTWTTLGTQYAGTASSWAQKDFDLATYTGNVRIRFEFYTDGSQAYEGWYLDDIEISRPQACGPEVVYLSQSSTDACSGSGSGGGNGVVEPGEDVTTSVTLQNAGISSATAITATLSSTSPGVTVTDATAAYPNLAAGASAAGLDSFSYRLDPGASCGATLNFTVHAVAAEGSWDSYFTVPVGAGGSTTTTTASTDVPKTINDSSTVTSNLAFAGSGTISDVNVTLTSITHTYDGDLDIFLIHPDGTRVELTTDNGGTGDNFTNTVFDDSAATLITAGTAPFTGSFKPEGSLATLNGKPSNGTWVLEVTDDAGGDTGTLNSWSITVTYSTPPVCNTCTPVTCTAPGAPTLNSATASCSGVALSWTAGSGTTNTYNVYRKAAPCGGSYNKIAGPVAGTSYSDTGAVAGTDYAYVVRGACDAGGVSESSDSNCLAATRPVTPSAPGAPALTAGCTSVGLSWGAVSGATDYEVWRNQGATCTGATQVASTTSGATAYDDAGRTEGTQYSYYIVAKNASCSSAPGTCATATTPATPAAPTGVSATGGCGGNTVTWSPSAGATSYSVVRGSACGTAVDTFTDVTSPYEDTSALAGTTYTYWVVAASTCGSSPASSCVTATSTRPPSVGTLMMTIDGTKMLVTWTPLADPGQADYYEVMRSLSPAGPFDTSVGTASGTIHGIRLNLASEPPTAYYKVRAVKDGCPGPMD